MSHSPSADGTAGPSRDPGVLDRAAATAWRSLPLALVPFLASLLSPAKVATALSKDTVVSVTFPVPRGLPTLWSLVPSNGVGVGGASPLSLAVWLPLAVVGLLVTSALEAGFLGAASNRLDGDGYAFVANAARYGPRMVGVNLVRFAVVLLTLPFAPLLGPLAVVVALVLQYLVYGLPFVVVAEDAPFRAAFARTTTYALEPASPYVAFAAVYLAVGLVASVALSALVYGAGVPGVVLGAALVALPSLFAALVGLLVFRGLAASRRPDRTRPAGAD